MSHRKVFVLALALMISGGGLRAQKILVGADFETRFRHASSNFARRFDDPKQVTHCDLLAAFATRDAETIQRAMRRHLAAHRNPQSEEKKRNNSPEVKGNHHESGKLL